MYNTVIAMGFLVKDPELKQSPSGKSICTFRVCISEKNAPNKCFIDVETWEKVADVCHKFLKKGREVLFDGELCMSSWTDKEGKTQTKPYIKAGKVKFLMAQSTPQKNSDKAKPEQQSPKDYVDEDQTFDEVPF